MRRGWLVHKLFSLGAWSVRSSCPVVDAPAICSTRMGLLQWSCGHRSCCGSVYTSLRRSQSMSFIVSYSTSPERTMLAAQHFRSSGLLCRRSDGLELTILSDTIIDLAAALMSIEQQLQSLKTNLFRRYHSAHTQHSRDVSWLMLYKSIIDIDTVMSWCCVDPF